MPVALDATYSLGRELSGVGVYCQQLLNGLCAEHSSERFLFCYRPHRFLRSYRSAIPRNARRYLMHDRWHVPANADIFHGLNQRMPDKRIRPSVCTFHDLFVMTGEYSTPEYRARFTGFAREAAQRADLIIAVSQHTANQVHDLLGVERSRLRVVHHGVRARSSSPLQQREPMVLHVGAIQRRKNVTRLVRAFEAVDPKWTLVLAGSAGFGAEETLDAVAASPARDRITITGYVTADQLASLYQRASVFAFPSLDEGFGMPVLEAMANGVPVLAANRSAVPEVCGDAAVLVNPLNADEIAGALMHLTADEDVRLKYSAMGLRRAAMFPWRNAVEQTWEIYGELSGPLRQPQS